MAKYKPDFVLPMQGEREVFEVYGRPLPKPAKGGPTEKEPDRPYCKPDQSCCDWCCGN